MVRRRGLVLIVFLLGIMAILVAAGGTVLVSMQKDKIGRATAALVGRGVRESVVVLNQQVLAATLASGAVPWPSHTGAVSLDFSTGASGIYGTGHYPEATEAVFAYLGSMGTFVMSYEGDIFYDGANSRIQNSGAKATLTINLTNRSVLRSVMQKHLDELVKSKGISSYALGAGAFPTQIRVLFDVRGIYGI